MITLEVKVILSLNNRVINRVLQIYKQTNVKDFLTGINTESEHCSQLESLIEVNNGLAEEMLGVSYKK